MDLKWICVLSVILVVALSTLAEAASPPTKCQCNVTPSQRKNCGHPRITAEECRRAGCCFNSSIPGFPWCFTPKARKVRKVCPSDVKARKDCGFPGITAQECERRGCCFVSHPAGVPWCFYRNAVQEVC